MEMAFQFTVAQLAALGAAILFMIVFPLVAAFVVHRRLAQPWRLFLYGVLVFFVSQMLIRIPLVTALQVVLGPQLARSAALSLALGAFLALTAGLFEEVGRYLGYRLLFNERAKNWAAAIMYGLGHGGFESMVLVGGLALANVVALVTMTSEQFAQLPPVTQAQLAAQAAQPPLLLMAGAWERLWVIIFHVAMSVVVLQVFRRGNVGWLWLAVALHALLNFTIFIPPLVGLDGTDALLAVEAVITLAGLAALWIIQALREQRGLGDNVTVQVP